MKKLIYILIMVGGINLSKADATVINVFNTNYITNITNINNVTNIFQIFTNVVYITQSIQMTNYTLITSNPPNPVFTNVVVSVGTNYIVASSGSFQDVSNAVFLANLKGYSTVWVPPGSNVWTSGPLIDSGVSLLCSNTCSILFSNQSAYGWYLYCTSNNPIVISNFVWDVVSTQSPTKYVIALDGIGNCFRFTKCNMLNYVSSPSGPAGLQMCTGDINGIYATGPWGLIDHCNFYMPGSGAPCDILFGRGNGGDYSSNGINGYGWTIPMSYGTTNTIMVENCNFAFTSPSSLQGAVSIFEGDSSLRFCVRYCNFTNVSESVHGTQSGTGGYHKSCMQMEMYMNHWAWNWTSSSTSAGYIFLIRGGSGVIWSNNFVNTAAAGIFAIGTWTEFWAECASSDWQEESCLSQITNTNLYPLLEQVGQGCVAPNTLGLSPYYMWNNGWPGATFPVHNLGKNADSVFIQPNRDVFVNTAKPGYTPLVYPHPLDK